MRDECVRVAGAGQSGATPLIIGGGPRARSGAGVSSAVFPPVTGGPIGPNPNVHLPYQPGQQYGAGGFGPSTPPPPTPLGQQGYQAPPPGGYGSGSRTPPPYTISPPPAGGGGHGGRSNTLVIVGAVAAALIAIGALVAVIARNGGGGGGSQADDSTSPTASASSTVDNGGEDQGSQFNPGDRTKTIDQERCTDAYEYYDDKSKVSAPDFTYKDINSVKDCLNAAGWKYDVEEEDENVWGKGIVLRQTPVSGDPFDPKDKTAKFVLTISTGKPQ
jgi:hypothetical protein